MGLEQLFPIKLHTINNSPRVYSSKTGFSLKYCKDCGKNIAGKFDLCYSCYCKDRNKQNESIFYLKGGQYNDN